MSAVLVIGVADVQATDDELGVIVSTSVLSEAEANARLTVATDDDASSADEATPDAAGARTHFVRVKIDAANYGAARYRSQCCDESLQGCAAKDEFVAEHMKLALGAVYFAIGVQWSFDREGVPVIAVPSAARKRTLEIEGRGDDGIDSLVLGPFADQPDRLTLSVPGRTAVDGAAGCDAVRVRSKIPTG